MKNIVILDAYSVDHGDVDFKALKTLGNCVFHDRTPPELRYERCKDADLVLTNKVVLDREMILSLPRLRYIGVLATGYNNVDVKTTSERGIVVSNVPAYSTESVVQLVFGFMIEFFMKIHHHTEMVKEGKWSKSRDFCFWDYPLREASGMVLGIIGYGRIGQAVARVARAFGMEVIVHRKPRAPGYFHDVGFASAQEVFRKSDVVTLHCPLTEETRGIINKNTLGFMKKDALLINTSRGPVVAEEDMAQALNDGVIGGAALDVLSTEPPDESNPLLTAKNCIITPHIGWATTASRQRLIDTAVRNVKSFLTGTPCNVVT